MGLVVDTKEVSSTVGKTEETQNGRRNGSSTGGGENSSLYSRSEESIQTETKDSSKEITSQRNQINRPSLSNNITGLPKISESTPPTEVHGFGNEKLHLQKLLSMRGKKDDNHFKAVGVVGAPGVGKTTLCQSIFRSEIVKRQFVPRIWVPMSGLQKDDDDVEVVQRMLERLGVCEETISSFKISHGINGLLYILHQQLIGKRYLIVLDDLQLLDPERLPASLNTGEEWCKQLSNMLPKGYGGRVIVTGRNEEFIKQIVGDDNLHQLQPLSDPESCWLIYRDSVKNRAKDEELNLQINLQSAEEIEKELAELEGNNKPSNTKPMDENKVKQIEDKRAKQREQKMNAEEIKRKCGGLPLAAKLLGEIKAEEELKKSKHAAGGN